MKYIKFCKFIEISNIPNVATSPHIAQLIRLRATDPEPSVTPFGDMKIPEPIYQTQSIFLALDIRKFFKITSCTCRIPDLDVLKSTLQWL